MAWHTEPPPKRHAARGLRPQGRSHRVARGGAAARLGPGGQGRAGVSLGCTAVGRGRRWLGVCQAWGKGGRTYGGVRDETGREGVAAGSIAGSRHQENETGPGRPISEVFKSPLMGARESKRLHPARGQEMQMEMDLAQREAAGGPATSAPRRQAGVLQHQAQPLERLR